MRPFTTVRSKACPIPNDDIDTDQIIPKQYLKRIERTGFGPFAFAEWRYEADGVTPRPGFAMNRPEHDGAQVLLTGRNFGCGSSREHAPWALEDAGFRAIIASSFADIFRTNCGKVGLLCVELHEKDVQRIAELVEADPSVEITVDLEAQRVSVPAVGVLEGVDLEFAIDPHTRHCLIEGLDDIGLTLAHEADITAYEQRRAPYRPLVPTPQ
jgi:3-isopropylmalate/(R)-2-methylmalate dehydratase small subunit